MLESTVNTNNVYECLSLVRPCLCITVD